MSAGEGGSPLVILVFDAGDGPHLERWAREGYLPTLDSLMKQGCWADIQESATGEHGIRLSLWSGVSTAVHGYYTYRRLKPGAYELEAISAGQTGVLPFWSLLRGSGKKIAILDAPEVVQIGRAHV